jgi:hypothetical protein
MRRRGQETRYSVIAGTPAFAGAGKRRDDIDEPTPLASQRTIPLEGWEEEQGARAAPLDLLPGDWAQERPARSRPHLPGRLLGRLTDPGRPRTIGFSASGPRIGAWMVCPPARRGLRTAAPGSCADGRFQDRRRLISEARAEDHISPRPSCSAYLHHQPKNLSPPLPPLGERVVGRNKATAALRRSTSSDNGAIRLSPIAPYIARRPTRG